MAWAALSGRLDPRQEAPASSIRADWNAPPNPAGAAWRAVRDALEALEDPWRPMDPRHKDPLFRARLLIHAAELLSASGMGATPDKIGPKARDAFALLDEKATEQARKAFTSQPPEPWADAAERSRAAWSKARGLAPTHSFMEASIKAMSLGVVGEGFAPWLLGIAAQAKEPGMAIDYSDADDELSGEPIRHAARAIFAHATMGRTAAALPRKKEPERRERLLMAWRACMACPMPEGGLSAELIRDAARAMGRTDSY